MLMSSKPINLEYQIEVEPGERLGLPKSLVDSVGPGRWLVTVQPLSHGDDGLPIRNHQAFLNGYAPEDEGLYDDHPNR